MININRGQLDTSVIVGIVFVAAIITAAGLSVYYFGHVKPRKEELRETKTSGLQTLAELNRKVDTPQFESEVPTFRTQIKNADYTSTVNDIVENVQKAYQREKLRVEVLNLLKESTEGSFHSFDSLYDDLEDEVNEKTNRAQLESIKDTIVDRVNSAWREHHLETIGTVTTEYVVMVRKNSPICETHFLRENARSFVNNNSWENLQEVMFMESNTFEVSVIDVFERVPTIESDYRVDVYVSEGDNMDRRVSNTQVIDVIYPKDVLSSVSWENYSTDIWEEIKASVAGYEHAKSYWDNWASNVVKAARENADIGDRDLEAIYVVEVTYWEVAKELLDVEHFQDGDVVLLARKP